MKVMTLDIRGQKIDVECNTAGIFSAEFDENEYTAKTAEELKDKLGDVIKKWKARKPVPVTILGVEPTVRKDYSSDAFKSGSGLAHAKLRSKHEREWGAYLYELDGDIGEFKSGKKFKFSDRHSNGVAIVQRLKPEEEALYLELVKEVQIAQSNLEVFVDARRIDKDETIEQGKAVSSHAK